MKSIVYTRVSTNEQSTARQQNDLKNLEGFKVVKIFSENISGFSVPIDQRPQLQAMLKYVKAQGIKCIMVSEVSRLGRNTHETLSLIKDLEAQGICLYIHNLRLTLGSDSEKDKLVNTLIVTLLSDLSRLEAEQLSYRIKSGIRNRKAQGLHTGRKIDSVETPDKFLAKHKKATKLIKEGRSYAEVQALTGAAPATISKIKKAISDSGNT